MSQRHKQDMDSRIGIATGTVTAGVIGSSKFSYDVGGRTVNIASRMESNCETGRIMVPVNVKQCLEAEFLFEAAGGKVLKGEGPCECWYLVGERQGIND